MAESFLRTPGSTSDAVLKKIAPDTVRLDADIDGEGNLEVCGPRPWVDVCAFGAGLASPTDLNADDSSYFQDAINSLVDASDQNVPGLIYVPPGIYPLKPPTPADRIQIDRPIIFQGAGAGISVLRYNASQALRAFGDNVTFSDISFEKAPGLADTVEILAFESQSVVDSPLARSNWQFERCEFKGVSLRCTKIGRLAPTSVGSNPGPGTVVNTGSQIVNNIVIVGCTFRNVISDYAVELGGVNNATIDHCFIFQSGKNAAGVTKLASEGIKVSGASFGVRVLNTISNENARDGIDVFDANQVTVANCTFHKNGERGIDAKWNWLSNGPPPQHDPNLTDRNIIAHNRVTACGLDGISVNAERTICIGNISSGNGTNPDPTKSRNGIYMNMPDPTGTSPKVTQECIIANNVAYDNSNFGIMVGRAQHAIVVGNVCTDNTSYGIGSTTVNSAYADLQGNVFAHNVVMGNDAGAASPRGISLTNENHRLFGNRSQDDEGAYLALSAKFAMRERYGAETAVTGQTPPDRPTLIRWPVGVIVRYTDLSSNVSFWLRLPGTDTTNSWKSIT